MAQYNDGVAKLSGTRLLLLGWGVIWRMTLWGFCAGVLIGSLYGCAIVFLVGGLYGVLFGGALGLGTGLLCWIVMAAITLVTLPRVRNRSRYADLLGFVPVGVILALEVFLVIYTVVPDWRYYANTGGLPEFAAHEWTRLLGNSSQLLTYYIPGIIGAAPAWYAGRQAAKWAAGE